MQEGSVEAEDSLIDQEVVSDAALLLAEGISLFSEKLRAIRCNVITAVDAEREL